MKKKVLIIATIAGFITSFEINNIRILQSLGYDVVVAANFSEYNGKLDDMDIEMLDVPFTRFPITFNNFKAIRRINKYVKENKVDFIHCHTPVGGVSGRIVGKLNKIKTIYTAHGFHFFDGGPKLNWMIYYPVEKILSRFTDVLITINKEDFNRAKTNLHAKKVEYIPGVGIDIGNIKSVVVDREKKRQELGVTDRHVVLLSVGELNNNKNHRLVLEALGKLQNKKIKYFIAGTGVNDKLLEALAKTLGIVDNFKLLGQRNDIYELCMVSDVFILPSLREGLSVALMEALVCNVPIVCSDIRGNNDLVKNGENGYLIGNDSNQLVDKIKALMDDKCFKSKAYYFNENMIKKINILNVGDKMTKIYEMI